MFQNLKSLNWLILFFFITTYTFTFTHVKNYRDSLRKDEPLLYLPPKEIMQIVSLDYKNLVSELLFFRAIVYFGDKVQRCRPIRLDALEKILSLEKAVNQYKDKFNRLPEESEELIAEKINDK